MIKPWPDIQTLDEKSPAHASVTATSRGIPTALTNRESSIASKRTAPRRAQENYKRKTEAGLRMLTGMRGYQQWELPGR
jgi:hypothetical protein